MASLGYRAKLTVIDILKPIKWQLLVTGVVILVGFIFGLYYSFSLGGDFLQEDALLSFLSGKTSSFSSLIFRVLSALFVLGLLWLFSKSKWLAPLALVLIFYRAYLLGINLGVMLRCYGVSGIIVGIIIIFPLQLGLLLFFGVFYWTMLRSCNSMIMFPSRKFVLISILSVVVANAVLALLLWLFSPNVILVL